jgi:hypothetical protein
MRVLSRCSTGLSRHERRDPAARGGKTALTVYSYNQAAAITGLARRTIERLIALGEGPAIIELSPRRRGSSKAISSSGCTSAVVPRPPPASSEREEFALIHYPPTASRGRRVRSRNLKIERSTL